MLVAHMPYFGGKILRVNKDMMLFELISLLKGIKL